MDNSLAIGFTYSQTGDYPIEQITIVTRKGQELAKGDLVFINHPRNNLPVVYQVTKVYPRKRVRSYEETLLSEGRVLNDFDSTMHAEAYQWGWIDEDDRIRPLRHPPPPNTPVFRAGREIISEFTKPNGQWKLFLGIDPSTDLEIELGVYSLIRQSCLICGAVGTGKTTTAISMIARAVRLTPPVRFFVIDKDGEYSSLIDFLTPDNVLRVPWIHFFQPSDIPWEDYMFEFGWQKSWWNTKILMKALKILYASSSKVTKTNLRKAIEYVHPEALGFSKKADEFEGYRQQVINAVNGSKLIPEGDLSPLDPVDLLKEKKIVIMDLSHSKDTWSQKQIVVAQVLRRIFNESLENKSFGSCIVLEEAMYYAPQKGVFEIGTKESRARLLSVVKEIATNGGRNGVGLWVVTQRLATVEKTIITQCANNIICHSLEDLDKQRLGEVVGEEFTKLIGDLPPGEAIVKGTALKCRFPIWVRIVPELYPASTTSTPMSRFVQMEKIEKPLMLR
ncbi:ATP-binding protein [Candidatus Bathyarchaeota archaeon]|nr:ATP-binding protein [Candidatus Bathyarchaeota archaeon]MBS7629978.1 ATP-binding protein [Candidatus Bathyarchaeota archaeon]